MKVNEEIWICTECGYEGDYRGVGYEDESFSRCPECQSHESLKVKQVKE